MEDIVLGIDLGTTSVKVSALNRNSQDILFAKAQETAAGVAGAHDHGPPLAAEQNVRRIIQNISELLRELSEFFAKNKVKHKLFAVGVTGQMHGIVLWKSSLRLSDILYPADDTNASSYYDEQNYVKFSHLFTWQDGRCSPQFLSSLPSPDSHLKLATGHGCATLFWLQRNCPKFIKQFDRAGTIMDLFVSLLCDLESPVMSVQNAASWGYFNCTTRSWNMQILATAGFPTHFLPTVRPAAAIAGKTVRTPWFELIPEGVDVGVGMGDLPCTMLPVLRCTDDGAINISTSAQVVTTTMPGFIPPPSQPSSPVEYFPYFAGTYLSVAAALTGGNVLMSLVETLQQWFQSLDMPACTSKDSLFDKLINLAMKSEDATLEINPILGGERHQPDQRGSIQNMEYQNTSLGEVFRATCRGIAKNLSKMAPANKIRDTGVKRMVGCGSALLRNPVLREEIEKAFGGLTFVYSDKGDASCGAALALCKVDS